MENKFIEAFKEVMEIEDFELKFTDHFRDYPTWDSLAQMSVVAMLDEEFDVAIEMEDFNKLNTVSDLIEEVKKRAALPN